MLDKPAVSYRQIKACLQKNYGFPVKTLEFLPLGLDTRAGVYRVTSETGTPYFLKLKQGALYAPSATVPRFLADRGIMAVVGPLPTQDNKLWFQLEGWTGLLYPFIEGVSSWEPGLSEAEWQAAGRAIQQIHQAPLPPKLFDQIRKETFRPEEYSGWMANFEKDPANFPGKSEAERMLVACWTANRATTHKLLTLMKRLAARLREQVGPLVICHADLHPGNMIRTRKGQVFMIDWDDVMLAPKERDFLFVGLTDSIQNQAATPFFQGYGVTIIDWVALTYYLCERVVTDLIACTRDTFFGRDLSDAARQESSRLFCDVLGNYGEVERVYTAARHLPPDLL